MTELIRKGQTFSEKGAINTSLKKLNRSQPIESPIMMT